MLENFYLNIIFILFIYFFIFICSNIMAFRKANLDAFQKKHGLKLGFMSAFLKASAHALTDQPVVNAVIDDNEIVYRDYVDISVAVATPKVYLYKNRSINMVRFCGRVKTRQILLY